MRYAESPPPCDLAPWIRCLWLLEGSGGEVEDVLPDGCPEIIVHYGDRFRRLTGTDEAEQPRAFVVGQLRRAITIAPTGRVGVFGVRMRPDGLASLLGVPAHETLEHTIPLDELVPFTDELGDRVAEATDDDARFAAAARVLRAHATTRPERRVAAAVRAIESSGGKVSVDAMARATGCSTRTLERLFRREVGLAPKLLARIVRFHGVFEQIDHGADWPLVAARCGYVDQAHLIRDFRDFTDCTPDRWLRRERNAHRREGWSALLRSVANRQYSPTRDA